MAYLPYLLNVAVQDSQSAEGGGTGEQGDLDPVASAVETAGNVCESPSSGPVAEFSTTTGIHLTSIGHYPGPSLCRWRVQAGHVLVSAGGTC